MLADLHGVTPTRWSIAMIVYGVSMVVLQYPVIRVLGRRDHMLLMSLSCVALGAGIGSAPFVPWPGTLACIVSISLGIVLLIPIASTVVSRLAPVELRGRYMGVWTLVYMGGYAMGPLLGGWALDALGGRLAFARHRAPPACSAPRCSRCCAAACAAGCDAAAATGGGDARRRAARRAPRAGGLGAASRAAASATRDGGACRPATVERRRASSSRSTELAIARRPARPTGCRPSASRTVSPIEAHRGCRRRTQRRSASGAPRPRPREHGRTQYEKGLKTGALGMMSSVVIGVASTAPAYSLAATLGLVAAAVGLYSPSVMIVAFIPMLLIASAYYYMNKADPDCGTSFSWVTRAFGPHTGWITGWVIMAADAIVMANLAQVAGQYFFLLFGWQSAANSTFAVHAPSA